MAGFFRGHHDYYLYLFLCCYCSILNFLFMGTLYKLYLDRLKLLVSSGVEENPGLRASRRSGRVLHANTRDMHKNL